METTQVIGITAAVITATAQLPQLIKIIKEKKVAAISLWMLGLLMTGLGLWALYGYLINDIPILATNTFSFFINLLIIILRLRYSRKK
jgi:MtN3 and saliva related transmembrane protein